MRPLKTVFGTVSALLITIIAAPGFGQFEESAKWVPETANTIVMVRANRIFNSDIAKKEKWLTEREKAFESGATFLPPTTNTMLLAAQVDFEFMEPNWMVSVFEKHGEAIDIAQISEKTGGSIELLAGSNAILLPNDAYLVKMDDQTMGAMSPANRQMTSRWLSKSKRKSAMNLSEYLTQAVKYADQNADLIVAFDFEDVMDAKLIHRRLKDFDVCEDADLDGVCDSLTNIKGVTLGITISDKISGAIKIDFDGSTANIVSTGKEILLNALKTNGIMIDDFANWETEVKENQFRLYGPLSPAGMRKIGSFIEHPIVDDFMTAPSYADNEPDVKTRSMQYFAAIQRLNEELAEREGAALMTYAKWFERYARQIDNLSVVNVDDDLLKYGRFVSDSYRQITMLLRQTEYDKVVGRSPYTFSSSGDRGVGLSVSRYGYGRYGSYYGNNIRSRQAISGQEKLRGANLAREVILTIDSQTAKIRQDLSKRYQIDF